MICPPLLTRLLAAVSAAGALSLAACSHRPVEQDTHADHAAMGAASGTTASAAASTAGGASTAAMASDVSLPAGSATVAARLARSPRHGEFVMIRTGPSDSVRAWVSYPERSDKAPVVLVVHEIYGLSTWIRGVADQLAADGYIAVAPDLLTGKVSPIAGADTLTQEAATSAIRTLRSEDVQRQLAAIGHYATTSIAAAQPVYGVVGFCWGGSTSFASAVTSPAGQRAAVVYYGTSPATPSLANVQIPVLGLYGGNDARVDATIPPADSAMHALGKTFEPHVFAGAGHGFLRQQDGQGGANLAAARQAWPLTLAFFRTHLGK